MNEWKKKFKKKRKNWKKSKEKFGRKIFNIRGSNMRNKKMDLDSGFLLGASGKGIDTKANLRMIRSVEKDIIFGQMVASMKGNGKTIKKMEREFYSGAMMTNM